MALPKLNAAPTYEMKIPSTGKSVVYRPFLVKEQKNLLIAFEAQNRHDLVRAVRRTYYWITNHIRCRLYVH